MWTEVWPSYTDNEGLVHAMMWRAGLLASVRAACGRAMLLGDKYIEPGVVVMVTCVRCVIAR